MFIIVLHCLTFFSLKTLKDESFLYFVFEYLPGGDLSRHLEVGGALPYETARYCYL